MQDYLGLSGDGKWGPNSQAAAKAKWGVTSADEAWANYQAALAGGTPTTLTDYTKVNNFSSKLHSEREHDAVMRDMYGSYKQYIAAMIYKDTSLSKEEQAYLIAKYGIQDSDFNLKK